MLKRPQMAPVRPSTLLTHDIRFPICYPKQVFANGTSHEIEAAMMRGSQIRRLPDKSLNTEIVYIYIYMYICTYYYIYLSKYFKKNVYHLESYRFLFSCFFFCGTLFVVNRSRWTK